MERASALYINMHIENKTALETIAPEITKDSRKCEEKNNQPSILNIG
jgi:hypothetical protein